MGGSSSGISYDTTPSRGFDCSNINITATISSPDSSVFSQIQIGSFLEYQLIDDILIVLFHNQRFGGIVHGQIQELINCIRSGTTISIKVTEINGAICRVKITNL